MKECEICWTDKPDFFNLQCCPHDICNDCIHQIRTPTCPFCRSFLPILSLNRTNSIFYNPPDSLHENYFLWSSMDDLYLYSRWYRRRRRRIERLRQREVHDRDNRERNRRYNLRRQVQQEVNDYLESQQAQPTENEPCQEEIHSETPASETPEQDHPESNNLFLEDNSSETEQDQQLSISLEETHFPYLNGESLGRNKDNKKK